jgi:hypothetical protein
MGYALHQEKSQLSHHQIDVWDGRQLPLCRLLLKTQALLWSLTWQDDSVQHSASQHLQYRLKKASWLVYLEAQNKYSHAMNRRKRRLLQASRMAHKSGQLLLRPCAQMGQCYHQVSYTSLITPYSRTHEWPTSNQESMMSLSPHLHRDGQTMRLDWLGWSRFVIIAQRRKQGVVSLLLMAMAVILT